MSVRKSFIRWILTVLFSLLVQAVPITTETAEHTTITDSQLPPETISIMSFNVRYGTAKDGRNSWKHRRNIVLGLLKKQKPDILSIQEAIHFQIDEIIDALPSYKAIGVGRDDGRTRGEHTAILYDSSRIGLESSGTFWFSETPDVPGSFHWGNRLPRICSWARFTDFATINKSFYVYNIHLDHWSQNSRQKSVALLSEYFKRHPTVNDPVIITGDFNVGENNRIIRFLKGNHAPRFWEKPFEDTLAMPFIDSFRKIHPSENKAGTFNRFSGWSKGRKIDYILVHPTITVHDASIIRYHQNDRYPSDHYPISAVISLPE